MPSARVVRVVAASVVAGSLWGCVVHVHDNGGGSREGWAYREGSALELILRPQAPSAATNGSGPPVVGTWTGKGTFAEPPVYSQRYYALEIRGEGSRRTEVRSLDEVDGLPTLEKEYDDRAIALRLRRDAGVLVLEGEKNGKEAGGNVRFERDETYAALATAVAGRPVEMNELATLAYANVRRADLEDLRTANQTVAPADLVRMRDSGVSGKFMSELAQTGRSFTLDDAIKVRNSGVTPEYIKNMREAGLDLSVEDLSRLKNNGVSSSFVKGLKGPDGALPPTDEIVRLRNSGVSTQYLADYREAGYRFTTAEMIRLNNSSVSSTYAKGMKEAGYDLSVDQLIKLRNSGVSTQYVKDMQEPGYERMSIEQIIEAKNRGLSAEFVKKLRKKEG